MAKFKFNLEAVLRVRRATEEERQRDLAKAMRLRMILEGQLRQMQETITQSKRDLGSGLIGRVDLDSVAQFARYSGQVAMRAQGMLQQLAVAEKQIETARERLLQASRDRKALELLRDRRLALWQAEREKKESAMLDELAVQAYGRKMLAGEFE
jgi:flagellar FliJ protein